MEESLIVPSYAKINLTLEVLGKREDGYHELISIMQTISLHDVLRFTPLDTSDILFSTHIAAINRADNLVMRAALLLKHEAGKPVSGVRIEMLKSVPIQGGLGGGSGDAAVTLLALNRIWSLSFSRSQLASLAARLGSDVPFFVYGGTGLIEGRGERVSPLPDIEPLWLVLAKPERGIATPSVFQALTQEQWSNGLGTAPVIKAVRGGKPVPLDQLTNSLEQPVLAHHPEVRAVRDGMLAAGAPMVRMSGSGPTLYAPFRSINAARDVFDRLIREGTTCWLCYTVSREMSTGFAGFPGGKVT